MSRCPETIANALETREGQFFSKWDLSYKWVFWGCGFQGIQRSRNHLILAEVYVLTHERLPRNNGKCFRNWRKQVFLKLWFIMQVSFLRLSLSEMLVCQGFGLATGARGKDLPVHPILIVFPLLPCHTYMHACIHTYMHACMHMYIHTYIHAYIHTYRHACMHTNMHTYIHAYRPTCMHAYIHTCIHTCMHAYIHTCMHACIHIYMHTYMHTYIHTDMHAWIHTYIQAYIHTYIHQSWFPLSLWGLYNLWWCIIFGGAGLAPESQTLSSQESLFQRNNKLPGIAVSEKH
jgi:hypothetical protein